MLCDANKQKPERSAVQPNNTNLSPPRSHSRRSSVIRAAREGGPRVATLDTRGKGQAKCGRVSPPVRRNLRCRVCGGRDLHPFLDLGEQPPANAFLGRDELDRPEARYPLVIASCAACGLAQLTHVVAPDTLFRNYVYFASVSSAMADYFTSYAAEVADRFVPRDGLIVEIGSNDGVLLRTLRERPIRVLGVDPARNIAEVARAQGVPTVADFFTVGVAQSIRREHGAASAILANNVFAHIDNLDDVMEAITHLLDPQGVFVIEVPYVVDLIEKIEFDTIYHEHLSYFGVQPLTRLFDRFGFKVFDVQRQPVHGGSIRVFGQHRATGNRIETPRVRELLALETETGLTEPRRLAAFAQQVAARRDELRGLVSKLRAEGKRVVGYTAPAKGTVLLNYCQLGPDEIEYLVDATPAKQGRYCPGMRIPIVSPEHFHADRPDYALLLAWNHAKEILAREEEWRETGGKFILPTPGLEVR